MTIKQQGGIFGRNPTFNDLTAGSGSSIEGSGSNVSFKVDRTDASTDGALVLNAKGGVVNIDSDGADKDLTFSTSGGTERARFFGDQGGFWLRSGNLVVDSGYGIDFSATSGTGTSELFSDYEEGTLTPELLFGGSNTGMTYTNQDGVYTKVGNVVHFQIYIRLSAKGSSTGNTSITGLPFSTGFGYNVPAVWWTNMGTGLQPFVWAVGSSTTLIVQANNSGSSQNITNTSFTDTSRIALSGTYRV